MEAIYLLIPLAAVLVAIIVAGFLWAVKSGQFDDLEGPAYSILMDDDEEESHEHPDSATESGETETTPDPGPQPRN